MTKAKLKEKYLWEIQRIKEDACGDIESDHVRLDAVLTDLLDKLGFQEVTAEYKKIEKWYA